MKDKSKIIEQLVDAGAPIPEFDVYEDIAEAAQYIKKYNHFLHKKKTTSVKVSRHRYDEDDMKTSRNKR